MAESDCEDHMAIANTIKKRNVALGFVLSVVVVILTIYRALGRLGQLSVIQLLGRRTDQADARSGRRSILVGWGAGLLALSPIQLPRMAEIGVDWRVAAFTLGTSLVTGVLLVVRPNRTRKRAVRHIVRHFADLGANTIGAVDRLPLLAVIHELGEARDAPPQELTCTS